MSGTDRGGVCWPRASGRCVARGRGIKTIGGAPPVTRVRDRAARRSAGPARLPQVRAEGRPSSNVIKPRQRAAHHRWTRRHRRKKRPWRDDDIGDPQRRRALRTAHRGHEKVQLQQASKLDTVVAAPSRCGAKPAAAGREWGDASGQSMVSLHGSMLARSAREAGKAGGVRLTKPDASITPRLSSLTTASERGNPRISHNGPAMNASSAHRAPTRAVTADRGYGDSSVETPDLHALGVGSVGAIQRRK